MGRKNDRERQKRLQRKREKREARRSAHRSAAGSPGSFASQRHEAAATCVAACQLLLRQCEPLEGPIRREVEAAGRVAGGLWTRLPFELEQFLLEGAQWTLSCRELEPAREIFDACDADQAFSRLWSLALTHEPDESRLFEQEDADCPYRAALAFEGLRTCLDDAVLDPDRVLRLIEREIELHSRGGRAERTLTREYRRLLATAVASVRLSGPRRTRAVDALAGNCTELLGRSAAEHAHEAWWACGRLFLAEVFERHAASGCPVDLARHPAFLPSLLPESEAALEIARRSGSTEPLRVVHFQSTAAEWRRLLDERIDPGALGFEDRIRYEIARLKLVRAQAVSPSKGSAAALPREWLATFEGVLALLSHGVPPASRAVPGQVEPPLIACYVDAVGRMRCEDLALPSSESLLRRHPHDFRLACLYATGVVDRGAHHLLAGLKEHAPWAHVDPELFALCAMRWMRAPKGRKAAAAVRPLLFDPLDREHRKQCLLAMGRLAVRRASTLPGYAEELQALAPYLDRDSFVYHELRASAALESGLVFLATMMAERHGLELELTEPQSQQWVSYAREIAQQSAFGSRLAIHHLRTPCRGFSLIREIRNAARARLSEFEPSCPSVPSVRTPPTAGPASGAARAPRERRPAARRSRFAGQGAPEQRGLFDALDP